MIKRIHGLLAEVAALLRQINQNKIKLKLK